MVGSLDGVGFPVRKTTDQIRNRLRQAIVPTYTPLIRAYVEAVDKIDENGNKSNIDVDFWSQRFSINQLSVSVFSVSEYEDNENNSTGKGELLKIFRNVELTEYRLLCVDTDYDHFKRKNKAFYKSDFTFQTYYYSVENIYYYPYGIESEINKHLGLSKIDLSTEISDRVVEWSTEYYEIFLYLLKKEAPTAEIDKLIEFLNLQQVTRSTDHRKLPQREKCRFQSYGITPQNMALYFRGHAYENKLFREKSVVSQYVTNIRRQAVASGKAKHSIFSQNINLKELLKSRDLSCIPAVKKINSDIQEFKDKYHT